MSHLIARFHSHVYTCLSISIKTTRCSCFSIARNYSRRGQTNPDPRNNVRYPYIKGDPIHEDVITNRNKSSTISKLKDKEIDNKKKETIKKQTNVFESDFGLKYEKLMDGDIRLGRTIIEAKSNQPKSASDTILLEGQRLIKDALLQGATAKSLYFCDHAILNDFPVHLLKDVPLYKILYRDMKTWSDATTPAGILGVFKKPQQGEAVSPGETILPITLIFDSLRDPGNAGTLIRTAAAVGCERIIATRGTVNLWDCKVLRSAMGGHFNVPIYTGLSWTEMPNYIDDNTKVFLASTWQSSTLISSFDKKLQIETLQQALDKDDDISDSDTDSESEDDSSLQNKAAMRDMLAEKNSNEFNRVPLPICEYSDMSLHHPKSDDSMNKTSNTMSYALVLGGETEGITTLAKRFAYSHFGQYVSVPMNSNVNSLNTGIAGSIVLYEMRKKLLEMERIMQTHKDRESK